MATLNKTLEKSQMLNWFRNNHVITSNANCHCKASEAVRQNALATLNECRLQSEWNRFDSTIELADRVNSVNSSLELLEKGISMLNYGMSRLTEAQNLILKNIQEMQTQEDCNIECLVLRNRRKEIDYTEDNAEVNLRMEQELLLKDKKRLQKIVDEALNQLLLLQDAHQAITKDIQNKKETIVIDEYQSRINLSDASLKINPIQISANAATLAEWTAFSRQNYDRSMQRLCVSMCLRHQIVILINEVRNELSAQAEAVDSALRERVHQVQQALKVLKWERVKIKEEMEEVSKQLAQVEMELESEMQMAKIAHTRLENRTRRPGVELCRDFPQFRITDEIQQLTNSRETLNHQQHQCRHHMDGLQRQLNRLNEAITVKENSVNIDKQCLELRQRRINGKGWLLTGSGAVECAKKMLANELQSDPGTAQHPSPSGPNDFPCTC